MNGVTDNWLNKVDLPTYNFSFYLVTDAVFNNPELLKNDDAILKSDRAWLIAQSGHTAGFGIDNVAITTQAFGGRGDTAWTQASAVQLDIHEVLGFELYEAMYTNIVNYGYKSFQNSRFVLKLEFKGRNPYTGKPVTYPNTIYYQLALETITARVGVEGTVYNLNLYPRDRQALDIARSPTSVKIDGIKTVNDLLVNLESSLNENEVALRTATTGDNVEIIHKHWKINYDHSMKDLLSKVMTGVEDSSTMAAGQVDSTAISDTIQGNTNIITYLYKKLNGEIPHLADERNAAAWEDGIPKIIISGSVEIDTQDTDTLTNQIVQIVNINISLGTTFTDNPQHMTREPANRSNVRVQNSLLKNMSPFIYKRYDFLYTGENTDVLEADLTLNAQYFTTLPPSFNTKTIDGGQFMPLTSQTTAVNPAHALSTPPSQQNTVPIHHHAAEFSSTMVVDQSTTQGAGDGSTAEQLEQVATEAGFQNLNIEIVGDPFWLGASAAFPTTIDKTQPAQMTKGIDSNNTGQVIFDTSTDKPAKGDLMMAFINFLPSQNIASTTNQQRGRFDHVTSGVYRVNNISNRFQGGKFTQNLETIKVNKLTSDLVKNMLQQL
jgi:hypothetical protein